MNFYYPILFALGILVGLWSAGIIKSQATKDIVKEPVVVPAVNDGDKRVQKIVFENQQGKPNMIITSVPTPTIVVVDDKGKSHSVDLLKLIERLR
jgi:hypothetical protein